MDTTTQDLTTDAPVDASRQAYERHAAEMNALTDAELVPLNVDVWSAMGIASAALPRIAAVRPQIAEHLPKIDLALLDRVGDYTLALQHAQAEYLAATAPREALPALYAEAIALRDDLLGDAQALVRRKLLDAALVAPFKGVMGFRNVASELLGLATVLRKSWATIAGKTAVQLAELDRAPVLYRQIDAAVAERKLAPTTVAEATAMRQRAFTLFVRAYDEARRAVSFLRWHDGDADAIVPSLWTGRGGSAKGADRSDATETSNDGTATVPNGSANGAPAKPAAASETQWAAPGMPGSNPFVS